MIKGLKIKFSGSKSECCTIKIHEVKDSTEETNECCEVHIESEETCCK